MHGAHDGIPSPPLAANLIHHSLLDLLTLNHTKVALLTLQEFLGCHSIGSLRQIEMTSVFFLSSDLTLQD